MRQLTAGLTLALLSLPAVAAAQPQPGGFHDCFRVTDANYLVDAVGDGVPLRLAADAGRFYPPRAARMRVADDVRLQCQAVTDRPLRCAVVGDRAPGFGFGPAAVRVAQAGRLTAPAGVWPLDVVVSFRREPLAHPIVAYC